MQSQILGHCKCYDHFSPLCLYPPQYFCPKGWLCTRHPCPYLRTPRARGWASRERNSLPRHIFNSIKIRRQRHESEKTLKNQHQPVSSNIISCFKELLRILDLKISTIQRLLGWIMEENLVKRPNQSLKVEQQKYQEAPQPISGQEMTATRVGLSLLSFSRTQA